MEKIDVIGNQMPSGHSAGRIINPDGIAPTVMENHGTITKVVEVIQKPRGKNKGFKKEMECCPTITSNAFEQNVLLGVDASEAEITIYDGYNQRVKADQSCVGALTTNCGKSADQDGVKIIEQGTARVKRRVRKLTERECWRLMGVKDDDYDAVRDGQSLTSMYHLAGDSIVTTVEMALFGELCGVRWQDKVGEVVADITKERR